MIETNSVLSFHQALELKKLQSPLYEQFYNTLNGSLPTSVGTANGETILSLPPKSRSPKRLPSRRLSAVADAANMASSRSRKNHLSNTAVVHDRTLQEIQPPSVEEWKGQDIISPRFVNASLRSALAYLCIQKYYVLFFNLAK